jgi:XTP/dITP diphosphohydrolase
MKKLLFATTNPGKLDELRALVRDLPLEILSLRDFPPEKMPGEVIENQDTFEKNATLKARTYQAWLGLPALADDSGLCVNALQGLPGV